VPWTSSYRRVSSVGSDQLWTKKVTPHRLVHDPRRTCARNLRRKGVSEGVIMKACGWKARSMFDPYNVIDDDDLARSVERAYGQRAANKTGAEQEAEQLS